MRKLIVILSLGILFISSAQAQNVLDGIYVKEHIPERQPIKYTSLREADVLWSKRVWREIDLKEKINHPLYYPLEPTNGRISLFDVIVTGVKEGTIKAFDITTDDFRVQLTTDEAIKGFSKPPPSLFDSEGNIVPNPDTTGLPLVSKDIISYMLKEDWFIDRQRSVLDVRIVGICPVTRTYDPATGAERSKAKTAWLYFPNLREVLSKYDAFNPYNDSERMSYDDLFWKRKFSSYITKETNVYDRDIRDYALGLDGLLESERIKDEIFNLEHDMWHF